MDVPYIDKDVVTHTQADLNTHMVAMCTLMH